MTGADVDRYLAEATHPWPAEVLTSTVTAIRAGGPFREAIKWSHPYFSLNGHAVVKLYGAGLLPASYALGKLGYSEDEIAQIRAARAQDGPAAPLAS